MPRQPAPPTATWRKSSYSDGGPGNCVEVAAVWHKSSHSGPEGGQCVEVSPTFAASGLIPVRDSKNPHGPVLLFPSESWTAFLSAVRAGDFGTV